MTLPNTNITISDVKNELGASNYELVSLCSHPNINMFSKYKPVHGTWPDGANFNYGVSVPTYTWGNSQSWGYLKPYGGSISPYRLGDYRGYHHTATPPLGLKADDIPTKINVKIGDSGININTFSDVDSISLSDVDLADYKLAIEIEASDGSRMSWTGDGTAGSSAIDYVILPVNSNYIFDQSKWRGTRKFQLFLSENELNFGEPQSANDERALHCGVVNGVNYIDSGILNIVSENTISIVVEGVKGNTIGGTIGFTFDDFQTIISEGDLTLRVVAKTLDGSTKNLNYSDIEVEPTYGGSTYTYISIGDSSRSVVYDSNNQSTTNFYIDATERVYYIRLNNCLNISAGGYAYQVDGTETTEAGINLIYNNDTYPIGYVMAAASEAAVGEGLP